MASKKYESANYIEDVSTRLNMYGMLDYTKSHKTACLLAGIN
jgi:hypothetical protein